MKTKIIQIMAVVLLLFLTPSKIWAVVDSNQEIPDLLNNLNNDDIKLIASDAQAYDGFGRAVAIAGEVALVGAYHYSEGAGAAYIFEQNSSGINQWGEVKKLTASNYQDHNLFGQEVTLNGDVAIVSAIYEDADGLSSSGAAYIYLRNQGGTNQWGEIKKLTASDPLPWGWFGSAVAIEGNTAIIGASGDDDGGTFAGAAYIFEQNNGGTNNWGEVKKLVASDTQNYEYFGITVDLDEDVAIVGVNDKTVNGKQAGKGAAYIFARNEGGSNNWGEIIKLTASDGEDDDRFGYSVAIDGDIAIVGAWQEADGGTNAGAVYVFEQNFGGINNWGQVKKITAYDADEFDYFGQSVALDGNIAIVGANGKDGVTNNTGAAYVYERNTGGLNNWGYVKKLASANNYNDRFGNSVAVADDTAVIGAIYDDEGATDAGAAYIFENLINPEQQDIKLIASDAQAYDGFGRAVAIAGEVALVGAYHYSEGAGAAYIFEQNSSGINQWGEVKKLTASNYQDHNLFGQEVTLNGDVAIVSAIYEDADGLSSSGAAYIYLRNQGGTNQWGEIKKLTASDPLPWGWFGSAVAIEGNTAIIGASGDDDGGTFAGAAYIFEQNNGGTNNWGEVKKLVASDTQNYEYFGITVDLDEDVAIVGVNDKTVNGKQAGKGAAYIFARNEGGSNNWGEIIKLTASDGEDDDRFGYSVAIDGDIAIVGAWQEADGGTNAGAVYVFEQNFGGINNWGQVKKITAYDADEFDYFGQSVALDGNIAIVGANGKDGVTNNTGAAYVYERNTGGLNNWGYVKKLASANNYNDRFGNSVAVADDTAVIGAIYDDEGATDAGAAYIFRINGPPPSETFTNAPPLPNNTDIATGNNIDATTEPGEQEHAGNGGPYHSVWWNWSETTINAMAIESAASAILLVDTHGSDFDTVLAVYIGPTVSNLTQIAANDDAETGVKTSEVSFPFYSGEIYRIVVDGKTVSDTGEVVLNYAVIPEPCYLLFIICQLLFIIKREN